LNNDRVRDRWSAEFRCAALRFADRHTCRRRCGSADHHQQIAAFDLRGAETAMRLTLPALGAVIAASIFIASMVAIVCPASTVSSTDTETVTTPATGLRRGLGWTGRPFRRRYVAGDAAITHHHRSQLTVEDAHHRAHTALVGIGDRLQTDQQLDAALQLYRCSSPCRSP